LKRILLDKFAKEKTPTMLLKELGSLRWSKNKKLKYFNQRFNRILKKFIAYIKPHESIIVDYYMSALSTNIS